MELTEIKHAISHKTPVICDEIEYQYISACIMRIKNNDWSYTVELLDKYGRSVTIAELKKVEVK